MKIAIDVVLLLILIWGIYNGYKRGLVNVLIAVFATCLALFAGSILSSTYSGTLMPAFEPFVAGLADTVEEQTLTAIGYGNSVVNMNDLIQQQPEMKQKYCKALYMEMGIHEGRAEVIAEEAAQLVDAKDMKLENAAVQMLSEKLLYVLGTALATILILILFTAFVNLVNLSFHLPNGEKVEKVGGVIVGILLAVLIATLICWFLSFFGGFLGKDTLTETYLGRVFLKLTVLTDWLL